MSKHKQLLDKIELFQKLALYGDREDFLKGFEDLEAPTKLERKSFATRYNQFLTAQAQQAPMNPVYPGLPNFPAPINPNINDKIDSTTGQRYNVETNMNVKNQYPTIDKNLQAYLNSLGSPFKLVLDGKKGPETNKALDWFKQTYGLTPTTPDNLTYKQLISEYEKKNNTKGLPYSHEINEQIAQKNRALQEKT